MMFPSTLNFILYIILFGTTVFINKYVLSVLGFTYPTIYQGWQTLVGGILLRLLLYKSKWLAVSPTPLDKSGFISLLPSFLFFVAGIVASSKALANLGTANGFQASRMGDSEYRRYGLTRSTGGPGMGSGVDSIGMFLCLHNTLASVLYLLEVFPGLRHQGPSPRSSVSSDHSAGMTLTRTGVVAAVLTLLTALLAVLGDLDITFSESPYFWLMVSLACVAVQRLHSRIADARYTDVDRLYCSYVFSVVVLAPASLYLEEAFDVLQFPHASRLDFMGACLLVGVVALLLSLHTIKVQQLPHFNKMDAAGKLVTSLASSLVFTDAPSGRVALLVFTNLCLGLLVPGVKPPLPDTAEHWPTARGENPEDANQLLPGEVV